MGCVQVRSLHGLPSFGTGLLNRLHGMACSCSRSAAQDQHICLNGSEASDRSRKRSAPMDSPAMHAGDMGKCSRQNQVSTRPKLRCKDGDAEDLAAHLPTSETDQRGYSHPQPVPSWRIGMVQVRVGTQTYGRKSGKTME